MFGEVTWFPRSQRAMSVCFAVVTLLSVVVFGLMITGSSSRSMEQRSLESAAVVRQGDVEEELWRVIDPDAVAVGLVDSERAALDELIPEIFGSRTTVISAALFDRNGVRRWTRGVSALSPLDGDEPAARLGAQADRVIYSLPVRPFLASQPAGTLVVVAADPEIVATVGGLPPWLVVVFVSGLVALWAGALVMSMWMLRATWGQTEKHRRVAMVDPLTGLANRLVLYERGGEAIANAARRGGHVGLVVVDLNRFKAVNDTGGHALGDRVLVEVARRMTQATRVGELAVRVGGDEFAVLVPNLDGRRALDTLAARLRAALDIPVRFEAADDVFVSASVGVAWSPEDGDSIGELFSAADAGMFAEKHRVRAPLEESLERAQRRHDERTRAEARA